MTHTLINPQRRSLQAGGKAGQGLAAKIVKETAPRMVIQRRHGRWVSTLVCLFPRPAGEWPSTYLAKQQRGAALRVRGSQVRA